MKTIKSTRTFFSAIVLPAAVFLAGVSVAHSTPVRSDVGFTSTTFAGNDDGSVGPIALGFSIDFYALTSQSTVYVNNNGNVTFAAPLGTYTPFSLLSTSVPIIAPFFADVDTRSTLPDVTYGTSTVDGHAAFGVNWFDVGFYSLHASPSNKFQLVIIDRSDVAAGDFDFEFNYERILWETGTASGGSSLGLGGSSARAGWSDGVATSLELPGSAVNGGLLDGNAITGLIHGSLNSTIDGRYNFRVRSGVVTTPEGGATLVTIGLSLLAILALKRRLA